MAINRCEEKVKMKYVLKTFLCANKGKKYTAKEIYTFIVDNKLNSKGTELNRSAISRLVKSDTYVLSDVKMEKIKGRTYFWVD